MALTPPLSPSDFLQRNDAVILAKSKLWLRRDKFFSKWRERYFTVTSSYLKCFETEEQSVLLWKVKIRSWFLKGSFSLRGRGSSSQSSI